MSNPDTASLQADSIPVSVDIVIGTRTMSLAELSGMTEGTVVEWEGGFPATARLVASGREIGSGRIVRVGDHLGLLVESLRP